MQEQRDPFVYLLMDRWQKETFPLEEKKYLKEQLKKKQDEERNGKVSEAVSLIFFDFLCFSLIFFAFL